MNYLKYFPYAVIIIFGFLAGLFYQSNVKNKEKLGNLTSKSDSLGALLFQSDKRYLELYNSKTKVDTIIIIKQGKTRVIYRDTATLIADSGKVAKIWNDSIVEPDLNLKYTVSVTGELNYILFDYTVNQKTININHIEKVMVPYPVDKLIPIDKRALYINGDLIFIDKPYTFIGVDYSDLKGFRYGVAIDPINKVYMGKIGYRILRF